MENLIFNSDKKLDTSNFVRVGDLSFYEGPLLSIFEDINSGYLYLFDWADRDKNFNRWLIYRVSSKFLMHFLNGKISHLELFKCRPNDQIYFSDIDSNNKHFFHYGAFEIINLPSNYLPNNDNFFDPCDCNSYEKIKSAILHSLSRQKSENEYSKAYKVRILKPQIKKFIYHNRIYNIKTVPLVVKHPKFIKFGIVDEPITNGFQKIKSSTFLSFKKPESKRKHYANQYN